MPPNYGWKAKKAHVGSAIFIVGKIYYPISLGNRVYSSDPWIQDETGQFWFEPNTWDNGGIDEFEKVYFSKLNLPNWF